MKPVGFDQKIQFQHLDFLAKNLNKYGNKEIYTVLDEALLSSIKGEKSRKNAITILMKIWEFVEPNVEFFKENLLEEYTYISESEKKCIHYSLTCIAYPFYREQMSHLGKHLKMADNVKSKVLVSQMKNLYGDRRRVEVASGAVLSSSKNWGIISMEKIGLYSGVAPKLSINDKLIKNLMIEVLMSHLNTDTISIEMLNNSALFFPFAYHITPADIDLQRYTVINNIRDTLIERNVQNPYSS